MDKEIIVVGEQSNGLIVYKKKNEVGGFTYYNEENSPSDVGALPVFNDCLVSIECLEIILNDMKKTYNQQKQ